MDNNFIAEDYLGMKDPSLNVEKKGLVGIVEAKDKYGNVLFKKSNIITYEGKKYVLEKIFNSIGFNDTNPLNTLVDRCICAFSIGNGAATSGSIGNIASPTFKDTALFSSLALSIPDQPTDQNTTGDMDKKTIDYLQYGPRITSQVGSLISPNNWMSTMGQNDGPKVCDMKFIDGFITAVNERKTGTDFYLLDEKKWTNFENDISVDSNRAQLSVTISENDLDAYGTDEKKKFNELGLYVCPYTLDTTEINGFKPVKIPDMSNRILFSHITFNNLDLSISQKITFTYYVYVL